MFICQKTGNLVAANTPANKLITKIRTRTYLTTNKYGEEVVQGTGFEIVEELLVCKEFYDSAIARGFKPEVLNAPVVEKTNDALLNPPRFG